MMKRLRMYILFFASIFFVERLTKLWAIAALQKESWDIFPGLRLVFVWNRGISWSLFTPSTFFQDMILRIFICLIIGLFFTHTILEYRKKAPIFFEMSVLVGAFSNLLDRFLFGAVIDFIECYRGTWSFPVFNGADMLVVGGVVGICVKTLWDGYGKY